MCNDHMSHLEEHELRCVLAPEHHGLHRCLWPDFTGPVDVQWETGSSKLICRRDDGERH